LWEGRGKRSGAWGGEKKGQGGCLRRGSFLPPPRDSPIGPKEKKKKGGFGDGEKKRRKEGENTETGSCLGWKAQAEEKGAMNHLNSAKKRLMFRGRGGEKGKENSRKWRDLSAKIVAL